MKLTISQDAKGNYRIAQDETPIAEIPALKEPDHFLQLAISWSPEAVEVFVGGTKAVPNRDQI